MIQTRSSRRERLEAFGAELDALRARITEDLGERDARYIRRVVAAQRWAEIGGRALLAAGVLPPAWGAGVALLTLSKMLENMEIGHNVMHGQYDWMNDPSLNGRTYEWDTVCDADDWRHSHNYVHHTFTNVVGRDRDIGYGLLRMAEEQPWNPLNVPQPVYALGLMLLFEWGIAVHDLELNEVLMGRKPFRDLVVKSRRFRRKALRTLAKDYVLFPLLAGPFAAPVFLGNLTANLLRNVWEFVVIFCGHFPEGVAMFPPDALEGESRGAWYARQASGSANIEGPRWLHVMTGHLSHQIEHHLFPDIPAPRYAEIAAEVEAICQRHGVPYNKGPLPRQLATAVARIFKHALPPRGARSRSPASAPAAGASPAPRRRARPWGATAIEAGS